MGLNTNTKRPDWLTDDEIKKMKNYIENCDNPYSKSDDIPLDGEFNGDLDILRLQACAYKHILTEYGLL